MRKKSRKTTICAFAERPSPVREGRKKKIEGGEETNARARGRGRVRTENGER